MAWSRPRRLGDPWLTSLGQHSIGRMRSSAARCLDVGRFTKAFSAVMWHERYEQVARGRRRFNSSGTGFSVITGRRELESELLLVWLPRDSSWIAVRDVIAIDGKRRSETDRHLPTVLRQPSVTTDDLKHLGGRKRPLQYRPDRPDIQPTDTGPPFPR